MQRNTTTQMLFSFILLSIIYNQSAASAGFVFKHNQQQQRHIGCKLLLSNQEEASSLLTEESKEEKESIVFTIPQFYPQETTPAHGNTYPSLLHNIYIQPSFLSPHEATKCLKLAKQYAQQSSCWSEKDTIRHVTYSTIDFPIEDCIDMDSFLNDINFEKRLWTDMGDKFDIDVNHFSFNDFFCVCYQGKDGEGDDDDKNNIDNDVMMDRLDQHRDGNLLSFTIVLSDSNDYCGGGTIFDALRDVNPKESNDGIVCDQGVIRVKNAGDAVFHSGKIKHGGHVVTKGERIVLVGFVNVDEICIRDGVLREACKEWGRSDVAMNRLKRQKEKMIENNSDDDSSTNDNRKANGWFVQDDNYDGDDYDKNKPINKFHIGTFVPAFSSVEKRGNDEYQRLHTLKAEDILLRDMLLPRSERKNAMRDQIIEQFGGDVTIL